MVRNHGSIDTCGVLWGHYIRLAWQMRGFFLGILAWYGCMVSGACTTRAEIRYIGSGSGPGNPVSYISSYN